jgi:Trk K+ transport system NAD-binding subunit
MKKQIAIIGQGQFGVAVATTTTSMGHDVLAVDLNEKKFNRSRHR